MLVQRTVVPSLVRVVHRGLLGRGCNQCGRTGFTIGVDWQRNGEVLLPLTHALVSREYRIFQVHIGFSVDDYC